QLFNACAQVRDDRLPGGGGLALRHQRTRPFRQVDVHARAESDHADALTGGDTRPFTGETDDAPCDQAGDLGHDDARTARRDDERVALVVLARLVEVRVDEGTGLVDDALDTAADRAPVHVTVEYAHENRHARQRPVAKIELLWRQRVDDLRHAAVSRGDHDAL